MISIRISINNLIEVIDWSFFMVRTISATEAKVNFGSVLRLVQEKDGVVIVENHGRPTAAIISIDEYQTLQASAERDRQVRALERLRVLQEQIAERNRDLTSDEADAIADELTRAAMQSLIAKGTLRFEE
jgi:prevent-host-death family protein